jgi:lipoprotein-releasing system permease protein
LFYLISVVGVLLGVWIVTVVNAVMGGFGETYREKITETSGDVVFSSYDVVYDWERLRERLLEDERVAGAIPFAQGPVMMMHRGRTAYPFLRAYRPEELDTVVPVSKFLSLGELEDLDDDSVFLTRALADSVRARIGSVIEVYTPLMLEALKRDEVLLPRELDVVGILEVGWSDFDERGMVGTLRLMQELYGLGEGAHGLVLRLGPEVEEVAFAAEWKERVEFPWLVRSWREIFADFLWVLDLEKNLLFLLLLMINVVAAFAIACALYLNVVRKTSEIGLLTAMGATPGGILACFCLQALLIAGVGSALGLAAAGATLAARNAIIHQIADWTGTRDTLIKYYQFADLPADISVLGVTTIVVASIGLAVLFALLPAGIAALQRPVEALRHG